MMRNIYSLIFLSCLMSLTFGQTETDLILDSIEIEAGVPRSLDFNPAFRVITEASDPDGRPLLVTVYGYDQSGTVQPLRQHTYQYEDGQTVNFRVYNWEDSGQDWNVVREEIYDYQDGVVVSLLRKMINNGQLENDRLWQYEYDANGNETELLLQEWDSNIGDWQFLSRKTTTYNENENILSQTLERHQRGEWNNLRRRIWTYEESTLQPSSTVVQVWSEMENDWINQTRKLYSMNEDGLWSGAVIENWNTDSMMWQPGIRETSILRDQGQEREQSLEIWQGDWIKDSRNIAQYEDGLDRARFQKWDQDSLKWLDRLRYFTRFEQGLLSEKLGMQAWSVPENRWENRAFTRRVSYYYHENQTTNADQLSIDIDCVIPNPYQQGMTFVCDFPSARSDYRLRVYNSLGQIVHQQEINTGGDRIDALLPAGIYITHISQGDKVLDVRRLAIIE